MLSCLFAVEILSVWGSYGRIWTPEKLLVFSCSRPPLYLRRDTKATGVCAAFVAVRCVSKLWPVDDDGVPSVGSDGMLHSCW